MRKLFTITATIIAVASAGFALAACSGERFSGASSAGSPAANSSGYERPGSITRAPLSPPADYGSQAGYGASPGYALPPRSSPGYGSPQGYGSPSPAGGAPPPGPLYGNSSGHGSQRYNAPDTAALNGWQASPRWSAVQGDGCIEVEQNGQSARAGGVSVEACSNGTSEEIGEGTPSGIMPQAAY